MRRLLCALPLLVAAACGESAIKTPTPGCASDSVCAADQYCNLTSHECAPGCHANAGCTSPKVCDVSAHACVECTADADCAAGEICGAGKTCAAGCNAGHACPAGQVCRTDTMACVACLGDVDCPSGQICDTATNTCHEGCSDLKPCASPAVCKVSSNSCVACLVDSDCSDPHKVCDTAGNTCVNGCSEDKACASPQVCELNSRTCVACNGDADCPDLQICNTSAHTCSTGCDADKPCGGAQVCNLAASTCVDCLDDTNCPDFHICNTATHACVSGCDANKPCETGVCDTAHKTCVACNGDADCQDPHQICNTTAHTCGAGCDTSKPCESPSVCSSNGNTCVACNGDADCQDPHQICNTTAHTCGAGCDANKPCAEGSVCDTSSDACVQCLSESGADPDVDCPQGQLCTGSGHTCANGCTATHACPNGQGCVTSACKPDPVVSGFSPGQGYPATAVTVTGSHFGATRGSSTVAVGGTAASSYDSWSDTQIVFRVAPGSTSGVITVTTAAGAGSSTDSFTVLVSACSGGSLQVPVSSGSGGYARVYDAASMLGGGRLTIEAWVFPTVSGSGEQTILKKDAQYEVGLQNGKLHARFYSGSAWSGYSGTGDVPVNQWSHVAATYDGWAVRTWVNGVLGSESAFSGSVLHNGSEVDVGAGTGQFNGYIDEVRISSDVRYAGAGFTPPTQMFVSDTQTNLLLHFDDGSGSSSVGDSSSHNTGGQVISSAALVSFVPALPCTSVFQSFAPLLGGAGTSVTLHGQGFGAAQGSSTVSFGGTPVQGGDYTSWSDSTIVVKAPPGVASGTISIALASETLGSGVPFLVQPCDGYGLQLPMVPTSNNAAAYARVYDATNFLGAQDLTLETWAYPTVSDNTTQSILKKDAQYELALQSGKLQARVYSGSVWSGWTVGDDVTTGAWHHLAMSYDGAYLRVFVDGHLGGSLNFSGNVLHNGSELDVGAGSGQFFGQIDELRVSRAVRYVESFSPPAGPFASDASTTALWHFDDGIGAGTGADASSNNYAVSLLGPAQISTFTGLGCGPAISDVSPRAVGSAGGTVTISGRGFEAARGDVQQNGGSLTTGTWTDTTVTATIPALAAGPLKLVSADGPFTSTGFDVRSLGCSGTALQMPTIGTASAIGYARIYDNTTFVGGINATVEAWIFPTQSIAGTQVIFNKDAQYQLVLNNNVLQARVYSGSNWSSAVGDQAVTVGQWSHAAMTYDGQTIRVFLNGVAGTPLHFSGNLLHNGSELDVGGDNAAAEQFFGYLDEARISSNVRYTSNFTPQVAPFVSDAATVGLWHFDDAPGGSLADSSSHGNALQVLGAQKTNGPGPALLCGPAAVSVSPRAGGTGTTVTIGGKGFGATRGTSTVSFGSTAVQAADYTAWSDTSIVVKAPPAGSTGHVSVTVGGLTADSGVDFLYSPCGLYTYELPYTGTALGYARIYDNTTLVGGDLLTVEAWVYPTDTNAGLAEIVRKDAQYELALQNGTLQGRVYVGSNWSNWAVGGSVLTLGAWHHVALVYDSTRVQVYTDGAGSSAPIAFSGPVLHNGSELDVGGAGSTATQFFGQIEEVRISSLPRYTLDFTPPSGPFTSDSFTVALWHFDDGPASGTAADSSTHANALQLLGASAIWPQPGLGCGPAIDDVAQPRLVPLGGGNIAIVGRGFGSTAGTVTQNGVTLVIVSWSDTQIVVTVPAAGTGPLLVTTSGGATVTTGVKVDAQGCQGNMVQLPQTDSGGNNGYLQIFDNTTFVGGQRATLEAWIYPTESVSGTQDILKKDAQYELALNNNIFQARFYAGSNWSNWAGAGTPTLNAWNHVAVVYDGWSIRTYLNGQLWNNADHATVDHWSGNILHNGSQLCVGSACSGQQFYGYIDELRISKRDLYDGVAITPAARHQPQPTDVGLWHFDEAPLARTAVDSSTSGNSLSYVLATEAVLHPSNGLACPAEFDDVQPRAGTAGDTVTLSGLGFGALSGATVDFNGTQVQAADYGSFTDTSMVVKAPPGGSSGPVSLTRGVAVNSSNVPFAYTGCSGYALELPWGQAGSIVSYAQIFDNASFGAGTGPGSAFTLEAWIYPTQSVSSTQFIVSKDAQYELSLVNNVLQGRYYSGSSWTNYSGTITPALNQWSHVAFVYSGGLAYTFVDGALGSSVAASGNVLHNGSALYVGGAPSGPQFFGQLDEVRVSSTARYTAAFTPPLKTFVSDASTVALWHFNDAQYSTSFADSSSHNNTLSSVFALLWPSTAGLGCGP